MPNFNFAGAMSYYKFPSLEQEEKSILKLIDRWLHNYNVHEDYARQIQSPAGALET
jgi:hypothetical protein